MKDNDKERGLLLGLHVGDALGATLEFDPPRALSQAHVEITGGGAFNWEPGAATDDTDMTICLLESLVACGGLDRADLAKRFVAWYKTNPKDVGLTVQRSIGAIIAGTRLDECGQTHERSQGNGSLMRCAPLALFYREDEELRRVAQEQASLTHAHPVCGACDYLFLLAVRRALAGAERRAIFDEVVAASRAFDPIIRERLERVPDTKWDALRTNGYVVDTLAAAMWALLHGDGFRDALIKIVNRGDDSDTCGAVAGALCGAFYGARAIPESWLRVIKRRKDIETLLNH